MLLKSGDANSNHIYQTWQIRPDSPLRNNETLIYNDFENTYVIFVICNVYKYMLLGVQYFSYFSTIFVYGHYLEVSSFQHNGAGL